MQKLSQRGLSGFAIAVSLIASSSVLKAAPQDRIRGSVRANDTAVLRGNRNPLARPENDRGAVAPETRIGGARLILNPLPGQAAELADFLEQQRDPSSGNYQRWLTPEEFGARFGASENDVAELTAWLRSQGLTVEETARAKNWIALSGTAAGIGSAFRTEIHRFEVNGEAHFANATDPAW